MKHLIVFDFDGVLADSLEMNSKITTEVCSIIAGTRPVTRFDIENAEGMTFQEIAKVIGVPENLVRPCLDLINKRIMLEYSGLKLFPGIVDVVESLALKGHVLTVVTNNKRDAVSSVLRKHAISSCFDQILGIETPGSKTEKLIKLRETCNPPARKYFMIGDSVSDIMAANLADFISIAVTWGFQSVKRLKTVDPDLIATSPDALRAFCS